MRRGLAVVCVVAATTLVSTTGAQAIVYGQPDGNRHSYVGALVFESDGQKRKICSGTLIDPEVYLTAGHCTAALASRGVAPSDVWVTFDSVFSQDATFLPGTYHTHPDFGFSGPGGRSDPHDIAVIVLDKAVRGLTPARLPGEGVLDDLHADHELMSQTFTAVGYGTIRETRTGGPQNILPNNERRYALQHALSLQPAWLTLSMNQATGDGGTCFGDSGGPHFLGGVESNLIVSITVTGDIVCKATDVTYRLDTASARDFLDGFVEVPS
jgi:trypsin